MKRIVTVAALAATLTLTTPVAEAVQVVWNLQLSYNGPVIAVYPSYQECFEAGRRYAEYYCTQAVIQ